MGMCGCEIDVECGDKNATVRCNRPNWDDVYNGYPLLNKGTPNEKDKNAEKVFKEILGNEYNETTGDYRGTTFKNACATRVSIALVKSRVNVKKDFLIQTGEFKGNGFIASAKGLKEWLSEPDVWGEADIVIKGKTTLEEVRRRINGSSGVYIILDSANEKKDHATLWVGANNDAIGGRNYVENGGTVYFWELKGFATTGMTAGIKKLLVKKIEGKAEAFPGGMITYEVIEYHKDNNSIAKDNVSDNDKARVRWAVMVNEEMDEEIGENGKNVTGEKVNIKMKDEWVGKVITVMACLEGFKKDVCQTTEVKSFPILIAESRRKPRKNYDGTDAEDMRCGDMTKEDIFKIFAKNSKKHDYVKTFGDAKVHFNGFEKQATLLFAENYIKVYEPTIPENLDEECRISNDKPVRVNLENNLISMIQYFRCGNGIDYSKNKDLTTAVMCHKDTIRFFNEIRRELLKKLRDSNGNIAIELDNNVINRPAFNGYSTDAWQGLFIAIHDTWAYKVWITEYRLEEDETYKGNLKIVIYDHFGLNEEDVVKGTKAHYFDCFYHWFVLQHWDGFKCEYKPFVTVMEKEMPFKGKL